MSRYALGFRVFFFFFGVCRLWFLAVGNKRGLGFKVYRQPTYLKMQVVKVTQWIGFGQEETNVKSEIELCKFLIVVNDDVLPKE
jgi:hypothetical protein